LAVGSDYELWDSADGNCVGAHGSEREALQAVAELVRRYGRRSAEVRTLGLLGPESGNHKRLIAEGDDLVDLALRTAAA
jgi:hypothetical protein